MPFAAVNGTRIFYRTDETAGHDAPWLVLSNSLGSDISMWTPQVEAFAASYRVLRYDTRGHGRSDAPSGPYTLDQLAGDVIALLDALHIQRAHFCGLSMGGLTGIALAARHPERFEEVTRLAAEEGFRVVRKTTLPVDGTPDADVVVLDTIGELARLYQIASVVFVGGSLVVVGFQAAIMIAAGVGGFLVDTMSVELVYALGAAILLVGAVLFGASNRVKA